MISAACIIASALAVAIATHRRRALRASLCAHGNSAGRVPARLFSIDQDIAREIDRISQHMLRGNPISEADRKILQDRYWDLLI